MTTSRSIFRTYNFLQMMAALLEALSMGTTTNVLCRSLSNLELLRLEGRVYFD